MSDALLGSGIKCTTNVHAHDEGLGWSQATTTVEELTKGAARKALTYDIDVLLTVKDCFAMIKDGLDARVAQATGDVCLLLEGHLGVGWGGGTKGGVDETGQRNDAHGHFLVGGKVGGIKLRGSGGRLSGFAPGLVELVTPAQDGARHVLWVPHDSKEPSVCGPLRCIEAQNRTE